MCCKTMGVTDFNPPKPPNVWCTECDKGVGCKIYQARPQSCRDFECLWLKDQQGILSDALRPDRIGVVVCPLANGATIVKCDPGRPTAWRHPKLMQALKNLAWAGYPVGVQSGKRYWIVTRFKEWEVPDEYKVVEESGDITVKLSDELAKQIGFIVRPEFRTN